MGQYQQWLYYHEVDQQLQAQLEHLEQELQQLQEQAALSGDMTSCTDNPIVQAIAMQQSAESLLVDTQELSPVAGSFSTSTTGSKQPGETVSSALFAWGRLPNLDAQEMQRQTAQFKNKGSEIEANPHSEITLLPEDMATFIDIHTPTTPRLRVSRLMQHTQSSVKAAEPEATPDDRTDYSIQRWRERWGRDASNLPHTLPDQQEPREDTVR
jgi:hypothetical protein